MQGVGIFAECTIGYHNSAVIICCQEGCSIGRSKREIIKTSLRVSIPFVNMESGLYTPIGEFHGDSKVTNSSATVRP